MHIRIRVEQSRVRGSIVHLGLKSFWQVPLTSCAAEISAFASCVSYSIQLYRLDLKMLLYFQTVDVDACA